jgi:hypothetical protein
MAVLDLQKMQADKAKGPPAGSRASKGCGNSSGLSLLLC